MTGMTPGRMNAEKHKGLWGISCLQHTESRAVGYCGVTVVSGALRHKQRSPHTLPK